MLRAWIGQSLCVIFIVCAHASMRQHSARHKSASSWEKPIPRILHQIFLSGFAAYDKLAAEGTMHREYRDSCANHHPDWIHKFWTRKEAERLVQEDFAWFAETWGNYTEWVRTFV